MHAVSRPKVLTFLLAISLLSTPGISYAVGKGGGSRDASGAIGHQSVKAKASAVQKEVVAGGKKSSGTLTPQNTDWEPPACWYEPKTSPKELKALMKGLKRDKNEKKKDDGPLTGISDADGMADSINQQAAGVYESYYQVEKYKNYNMAKQGKGMFWEAVKNPARKNDPKANSCTRDAFWVDNGKTPDAPLAVSPKVLAQYAYGELPIPDTHVSLSPQGKQTVNLKTWAWLEKTKFQPVKVTARLPGTGLSATTTARPTGLTLDPGTADADTYPGSGTCPVTHGRIGEPYTRGDGNRTPSCGLTYLRATHGQTPYKLTATLNWKISWKGSDGTGGQLPSGAYQDTENVTVGERQTVNTS